MRKLVLIFSVIFIVGCGFKLRGVIDWPAEYQTIYMDGYTPSNRSSFYSAVQKFLPEHVDVITNNKQADVIIQILSETQTTRTISALAANRDTEEVVTLTIVVQVLDKTGKVILPPTTLSKERDFTYDESNLLGKSTDFANVNRILRQELAAMFVRRLEAALKVSNEIESK